MRPDFMRKRHILKLWAWSLGFFLLWMIPGNTQTLHAQRQTEISVDSQQAILQKLAQAHVVYLGETHNRPEDHQAQLEIIQALAKKGKVAIAMEMFQRPYQGPLDAYLARQISETEFLEQTEYEQRWGFPWENYAPILQFAQDRGIPVLAINTPSEITRKVARGGLEALTAEDRQWIPPISEIRTDNANYRQLLEDIFQQHAVRGQGNSDGMERFFLAQVLWDETMAHHIAQFVEAHPDYQVIVLAGQGHVIYGYGIPSRVSRRLSHRPFQQYSVLFDRSDRQDGIADFFW